MTYSKEVWVIMDKTHRVIACGNSRDRYVTFLENALDARGGGIRVYETEGRARSGFTVSQFFLGDYYSEENKKVEKYMYKHYGKKVVRGDGREFMSVDQRSDPSKIYEAVKVKMTMEVTK